MLEKYIVIVNSEFFHLLEDGLCFEEVFLKP